MEVFEAVSNVHDVASEYECVDQPLGASACDDGEAE